MENFDIQDDISIGEDFTEPQLGPTPPKPGIYQFKAEKFQFRRDKDGNMVRWNDSKGNPTYPVLGLTTVSITEPAEMARKVVLFQDVSSKPFDRDGAFVSNAADLLRSIDADVATNNTGETLAELVSRLNGVHSFRGRLDVEAYDKQHVENEFVRLGGRDSLTKDEVNKVYNSAKIRGGARILKDNATKGEKGGKLPYYKWIGPSGEICEARPVITQFIPSTTDVALGVDKAYQPQ